MAEGEIIPIGLALDTSQLLRGVQQAQAALTQMGTATDALLAKLKTAETAAQVLARTFTPLDTTLQRTAQAETQASQAAAQLTKALQQSTEAAQANAQATQANTQALTAHRQAAQQASTGVSSFGSAMGAATSVLGAFGVALSVRAVVEFGKSLVETGVKMEQLRRSLTAISGSATVGRQEFAFVTDTANRLGIGIETLATSYRGLTASTRGTELAGQDTQALFTTLSAASRTYGMSTEQTGRALLAFQQIISKGKISQEELRQQLAEALPGASQIAARAFGVTTQELDKMIEKGMSATEFTRRFTAQLAKEMPTATAQAGAGFIQLGNEIVLWKDRMAKEGVLKFFEDLAAKAAKVLEASRTAAAEGQSATQRSATRAIGGEDPAKLLPENQRKLMELSALVVQAENDLAQKPGSGLSSVLPLLRQQQTELGRIIRLEEQAAQKARERGALLTEPGPQFDAQERARTQQAAEQKVKDAETTQDRFKEIDVRTQKAADAEEKTAKIQERLQEIQGNFQRKMAQIDPTGKTALDVLNEKLSLAKERTQALDGALGKLGLATGGGSGLQSSVGGISQQLVALAAQEGIALRVTSGLRTAAEQARLYAQGRTTPGSIVTNAPPGMSRHETGRAFDVAPLNAQGQPDWESPHWARIGAMGKSLGLEWGGDWKSFKDRPHFQLPGRAGGAGGGAASGMPPMLAQAQAEEAALRAQVGNLAYTGKLEKEVAAANQDSSTARAAKLAEGEQLIAQLERMAAAYTKPKEARDLDTAAALVAKVVMSDEMAVRAKALEVIIQQGVALKVTAEAEKEHADAVEKAVKVYASAEQSLERYQEQLGLSGGGKITSEARAVTRAEKDLKALWGGPHQAAAQKVVDVLTLQAKEAEPGFQRLTRLSEDFADSFLSTMERATQGGIKSFKEFAQSVLQDLMRMANQEFLKPALQGLIKDGLKAASLYFAPNLSATGAATLDASTYGGGDMDFRASGGPVTSNTPYVVGERGPEVFVPSQSGTIVPHGASVSQRQGQQAPPMIVNIYGVQDAAGLARSRGEIQRQMLSAWQQAQRAA